MVEFFVERAVEDVGVEGGAGPQALVLLAVVAQEPQQPVLALALVCPLLCHSCCAVPRRREGRGGAIRQERYWAALKRKSTHSSIF